MLAALMARPFIEQAEYGDRYKLPPEGGPLTPENRANYISAKHNVSKRGLEAADQAA